MRINKNENKKHEKKTFDRINICTKINLINYNFV